MSSSVSFLVLRSAVALACFSVVALPLSAMTINNTTIGANQITINGSGFTGTPLSVTFNGASLSIVSSSASQIVATVNPLPATGTYRLVVKAGSASSTIYVNVPSPAVLIGSCYEPSSATVGAVISLLGGEPCEQGWQYPPTAGFPMTSSGIMKNLQVRGQFDGTVIVYMNYVPTVLSCSINVTNPNTESNCSDTSDVIRVNAGDELNLALTVGGSGGASSARASVEFLGQ
jgi:hypothetical protein